jgi:anti-sigma regulatory factor (Ser/Thr protein kinase)
MWGGQMVIAASAADSPLRHLALFYRGRDDYLSAVRAFIRAGRAHGDAVMVAVPARRARLLRHQLQDDAAYASFVDMTKLGRNPARIIPAVRRFARGHRGRHFYCIGEPIWPDRTAEEVLEAVRHDALINLAFRDSSATIVCPYDHAELPRYVIADAARTHPAVISDGVEVVSDRYLGPGLPARYDRPLPAPPGRAETLAYSGDLRPVRGFVARKARGAGLASGRADDLVLAVSELATNTLGHTAGGGMVRTWRTSGAAGAAAEIICQVEDSGQITDPLAMHRAPSDGLPGGKGLWVVNQLCDLVQARTGPAGTTTRLHMSLPRP